MNVIFTTEMNLFEKKTFKIPIRYKISSMYTLKVLFPFFQLL